MPRPCRHPLLAVDAIIFQDSKVLLVDRTSGGLYALPGGFVNYNETTEEAVVREVKEETNLDITPLGILGIYSDPKRDPRGHIVSVVYLVEIQGGKVKAGDDAFKCRFFHLNKLPKLAFDHNKILSDFREFLGEL